MRLPAAAAVALAAGASGRGGSMPGKSTYAASHPFAFKEFVEAHLPTMEGNEIVANNSETCVEWVKLCIDDGTTSACGVPGGDTKEMHVVGAYKRDSGAKSMEAIETEFSQAFGAMKTYDPYFEYNMAFYTADLDAYVSDLTQAGVPHFASTFTDPATKKQYSSILFQVPGSLAPGANSLVAIELLGNSSGLLAARPGVHRYELPRASPDGLARAAARVAAAPRKLGANGKPVLAWVHLSFASSDLARDVQWFEKVLTGTKVYEGSAAEGQVYSGVLTPTSTTEVRYVQSALKTQGPTSVAQWEKYQTDLHAKCMPAASDQGMQGFDRLADNHFDKAGGGDLTAALDAHKAMGLPYRFYGGIPGGRAEFAYIYGPGGWGVQLIGTGLPATTAGYDFCTQGITGQCSTDGSEGGCYLKYSADGQVTKAGATALLKQADGTCAAVAGADIQNAAGGSSASAPSSAECCALCAADAQCAAAVFVQ